MRLHPKAGGGVITDRAEDSSVVSGVRVAREIACAWPGIAWTMLLLTMWLGACLYLTGYFCSTLQYPVRIVVTENIIFEFEASNIGNEFAITSYRKEQVRFSQFASRSLLLLFAVVQHNIKKHFTSSLTGVPSTWKLQSTEKVF
jgi:hypothetical protein